MLKRNHFTMAAVSNMARRAARTSLAVGRWTDRMTDTMPWMSIANRDAAHAANLVMDRHMRLDAWLP